MKKFYILGLMGLWLGASAQQATKRPISSNESMQAVHGMKDYTPPSPVINQAKPSQSYGKYSKWQRVGQTMFDRPTNASVYRRINVFDNGKISVAWTTSADGPANGYLSRGSGYNHYNGTSWINPDNNMQRIEPFRTGYVNLDYIPGTSAKDLVIAHKVDTANHSGGVVINKNLSLGSNTWSSEIALDTVATVPGVLWPRTVVTGDYMIVIASYTDSSKNQPNRVFIDGIRSPVVYSRYHIPTSTWVVKNRLLPGYDNTRYGIGGGDNYSIDADSNVVAVLLGALGQDLALWKSTDYGDTWTKTIIDSFPIPAYTFKQVLNDTPFVSDGAVKVILDNQRKAHCFWGLVRMTDSDTTNNTFTFFPSINDIEYWYEGRPDSIKTAAIGPEDPNDQDTTFAVGSYARTARVQYGNVASTTAPDAAIDAQGRIFLTYMALTDNDLDGTSEAYHDIYCVYSEDNGVTWSTPRNLTAALGFNTEQVFASVAENVGPDLHITFLNTGTQQGFYDETDNPSKTGPYDVMYLHLPVADILSNHVGVSEVKNDVFTIDQNYPNPFTSATTIPVMMNKSTDVKVSIVNVIGQNVFTHTFENAPAGLNKLDVSLNNVTKGIYFYTVEAEGFKVTRRMMVD